MQVTDASHGTDDPTPSAAGGVGDGLDSEAKGEDLDPDSSLEASNTEAVHCSMVEDGGTGEVIVLLVTQPHGISSEGHVASADPVHIIADRVPEHPSASGSRTTLKPNQGGKASGRQRGKKQRQGGSVKVPEIRSPPSQSVKPYDDNYADLSSEDNENKYSTTKQAKRTPATTDSTTARRQFQRGDGERSNGTPSRRSVFAPVPDTELNRRMGTTPNQTPEKYTPTKTVATTLIQVFATEEESVSPILSLQKAGSNTGQVVAIEDESDPESEDAEKYISGSATCHSEEESIEAALHRQSVQLYGEDDFDVHHDSDEHHDSDKENVPVREVVRPGFNTPRRPLQTLYSAPSPPMYQSPDSFITPTASQKLARARYHSEAGRQWQMVVDSKCLLNKESFDSLKQLEGIRETRLVIPNIVLRELDCLKQNDRKDRASAALQWIAECMLEKPFWIHVQSAGEFVHVAMTPPVSPSLYRGPHSNVSESPLTLHDHVLECALFQQTMPDGRVAILTDDTTLKIKALAERLVVDTAIKFCDSLLNPYSDRFVYIGSTPVTRSTIGRQHEKVNDGLSTPGTAISSSKWLTPAVGRSLSRQDTPRPSSRANFSIWRKSQPLGLQALL